MNGYPAERWRREVRAAMNTLRLTTSVLKGPMAPKDAVRFTDDLVEACRELEQLMRQQPEDLTAQGNFAQA